MKMFKLIGKRGFAVFTSLALCASLVAPAFAATFTELQTVINNGTSLDNRITYDNGKITLNENVTYEDSDGSRTDIQVNGGKDITLDLNGYTITGKGADGGSAIYVYQNDTKLTIQDGSDGKTGQITGGGNAGIFVEHGASVEMQGGTITGNTTKGNGGGVVVSGSGSSFVMKDGKISGNDITGTNGNGYGGGVYVTAGGSFTMKGGEISGNTAKSSGGGVGVNGTGSTFTMEGGVISGNTAGNSNGTGDGGGGGVWIKSGATFTMTNGEITGNKVDAGSNGDKGNGGGVAIHQAEFTMNGGSIHDNESARGTGVLINANSSHEGNASFTMKGGYVSGKDDTSCIYLEESEKFDATLTLEGKAVLDGSVFLGKGTQVKTSSVKQPNVDAEKQHDYTGFDVTDKNGKPMEDLKTIGKNDSEVAEPTAKGYENETGSDLLLDITYNHVYGDKWASDDENTHSHSCEYCSEKQSGSAVSHNWINPNGVITKAPTETEEGVRTFTCQDCGETKTEPISATGTIIEGPDVPLGDLPVEIDDPEVPLAGLLTRADVIGYLWEQAGSPEAEPSDFADVSEDHEWAAAIGWAQANGIAVADLEGNFRPDDLVLRSVESLEVSPEGEFQEFLNRYAVYAGVVLEPGELFIELEGEWDDIIMGEDAQVILDDFFVRLELALAQAA